jgi:probable HAF family extracellular repeat protein
MTQQCLTCGFVFKGGKYISINYPSALNSLAFGLNNAGQVVGSYTLDNMTYHGFVTSPLNSSDFE